MKNQKIKVELWSEIDDNRAEHLNGGNVGIYVYGSIGAVQYSGDKQTQVNVFPDGKAGGYHNGHYYRSVYTYYPGYGYYHSYQSC